MFPQALASIIASIQTGTAVAGPFILEDKTKLIRKGRSPTSTTITGIEAGDVVVVNCAADGGGPNPSSSTSGALLGFTRLLSGGADVRLFLYAKVATSTSISVPVIGNINIGFTTANIIYVVRGANGIPILSGPSGNIFGGTASAFPCTTTVDDTLVVTSAGSDDNGAGFSRYPTPDNNIFLNVGAASVANNRVSFAQCSFKQGPAGSVSWPTTWRAVITSEPIVTHSLRFAPA